jgi:hypothetical protein
VAVVLFVAGVRYDHDVLRWTAVVLLVSAFALRFIRPRN